MPIRVILVCVAVSVGNVSVGRLMGRGDSGQAPISPCLRSGPSLSCSGWLANRKWSGWDGNSATGPLSGALEPDQDIGEPGDESWTQRRGKGLSIY